MPPKNTSRTARWAQAAGDAQAALDAVRAAAEDLNTALEALRDIQTEYQEWRDNLPENLAQSALAEKLDAVADLDLDVTIDLDEIENAIGEAEGADLPLGFGRD